MAVNDNYLVPTYNYVTTTASSTAVPFYITPSNVTWGNGGIGGTSVGAGGGGGGAVHHVQPSYCPPVVVPAQSALEWLDAEVEKTCALARAA